MKTLARWAPGIGALVDGRANLRADAAAGAVLAAVAVPLGMAYAGLAGLEPVAGLYATVAGFVAYAVFGPSRVLVTGPDSSTAPLVAAAIVPLASAGSGTRIEFAALLGVMVGVMILAVRVARLGFITDLLAKPVRLGYLNGVAVTIIVGQLARLFGFEPAGDGVPGRLVGFATNLGSTALPSLAFGILSLVTILVLMWRAPRLPGVLGVVIIATLASAAADAARAGVETVGDLPSGLPSFVLPAIGLDDVLALAAGALGITVITLADTAVLSQALSGRAASRSRTEAEFVGLGAANIAAGLMGGFPISGSASRSAVNEAAGARSQLSGLIAGMLVLVMLLAAPGLVASLPLSVLAAIVVAAGIGLVDIRSVARLWEQRRTEFSLCAATTVSVVFLGVLPGVFIAVALSVLNFLRRQWWPHDAVLGRVPGVKGYHDITDFDDAREVPGLLLYRFDAPLFFANARIFRERLEAAVDQREGVSVVILAAEPLIDVDTTAADVLAQTIHELGERGVVFGFAELKSTVRERLTRYGIMDLVDPALDYPTLGLAVHSHVARSGAEWTDWEDQSAVRASSEG